MVSHCNAIHPLAIVGKFKEAQIDFIEFLSQINLSLFWPGIILFASLLPKQGQWPLPGINVENMQSITKNLNGPQFNNENYFIYSPYRFSMVDKVFPQATPFYPSFLTRVEFERKLIAKVPFPLRKRFMKILGPTLELSERYQVDPLWVLSVMWTEGHFNHQVRSSKGAEGPMQIMKQTQKHLAQYLLHSNEVYSQHQLPKNAVHNIEMGIIYLKQLLQRFNQNAIHATVAYNMGPTWTQIQLAKKYPVGKKNQYLNKVLLAYQQLSI